jgi:dienelactone hydrolase
MTSMRHEYAEYNYDGTTCRDSFYVPDNADVSLPVVLVIPDYHGATEYVERDAQTICELGYVGYCIDFYGERAMPKSSEAAGEMIVPYIDDRPKALNRLVAAREQAQALDVVDSSKTAVIGYSSGGMYALDMARRIGELTGAISVWGVLTPWQLRPFPMIEPKVDGPKILILQGTDDPFNPLESILGIMHEFDATATDYQLVLLGGKKHAFGLKIEDNLEIQGGEQPEALLYDADADSRSRTYVKEFLAELFA